LEELGFYNPRTKETRLDTESIRLRLSQGAQPTDSVRALLEKGGLVEKRIRPAEIIGKRKQATTRAAEAAAAVKAEADAKAAAEAKAAEEAAAAVEAAASAALEASAAAETVEAEEAVEA